MISGRGEMISEIIGSKNVSEIFYIYKYNNRHTNLYTVLETLKNNNKLKNKNVYIFK